MKVGHNRTLFRLSRGESPMATDGTGDEPQRGRQYGYGS
jgi:hypothetical protein